MDMSVNVAAYRQSAAEQERTMDLLSRLPDAGGATALDIGARDGHFSKLLAEHYGHVVALDLEKPTFEYPGVECVKGDATGLQFASGSFDLVFCAEVLEHIPEPGLGRACAEIERVARDLILIGVPYKQDLRIGRTTCQACGHANPPWGHVNSFDEAALQRSFPGCSVVSVGFVGQRRERTNALTAGLLDYAGNPFGTYRQQEPCVYCGQGLGNPGPRSVPQRLATRLAHWSRQWAEAGARPVGNWIHMLLRKR